MWFAGSVSAHNRLLWRRVSCIRCRTLFPKTLDACPHCADLTETQLARVQAKRALFAREAGSNLMRSAVALTLVFVALYTLAQLAR